MMRNTRRRWRYLLTTLLAAQFLPAFADDMTPARDENLASVESFCVNAYIQNNSRSAEDWAFTRHELAQEIADMLAEDAVLYALPFTDPPCSDAAGTSRARVVFIAVVLDTGIRYDLSVLLLGRDAGPMWQPTIYRLGGIVVSNETLVHDEVPEILLEAASDLFRTFALDWKEVH